MSQYLIPTFIFLILAFAFINGVDGYSSFLKGAKEGLKFLIEIIPIYFAMVLVSSLLVNSNIINDFLNFLNVKLLYTSEVIIQMFLRPISGTASLSLMVETFFKYGVDSKEGIAASIIQGATDTTFYVVSMYFGVTKVKKTKKILLHALIIDIIGFIIATILLFLFIYPLLLNIS